MDVQLQEALRTCSPHGGHFHLLQPQGTPTFALFRGSNAAGEKWEDRGSGWLWVLVVSRTLLLQEFKPKDLCEKIMKATCSNLQRLEIFAYMLEGLSQALG